MTKQKNYSLNTKIRTTTRRILEISKKLEKASILKNIGACIGALGIIAPAIMLGLRKLNPDYQVRKDIEKKLANQQA